MTKEGEEIEILKAYRDKLSNSASNQLDKDIKAFDAAIEALEQEPETGYWIEFVVNRQHKIRCSKCNYVENEYITHIRNYCPNCGAKMKEKENEE